MLSSVTLRSLCQFLIASRPRGEHIVACGTNAPNHEMAVADPRGAIYLRRL